MEGIFNNPFSCSFLYMSPISEDKFCNSSAALLYDLILKIVLGSLFFSSKVCKINAISRKILAASEFLLIVSIFYVALLDLNQTIRRSIESAIGYSCY